MFDGADACVAPVLTPDEVWAHPQVQARCQSVQDRSNLSLEGDLHQPEWGMLRLWNLAEAQFDIAETVVEAGQNVVTCLNRLCVVHSARKYHVARLQYSSKFAELVC